MTDFASIIRYYVKPRSGMDSVMRPVEWLEGVDECAAALAALMAKPAPPSAEPAERESSRDTAKPSSPLHTAPPESDEFLEFKEALADIRSLRQEHRDLNGGGPGWVERNRAAWAKADELFANEDEAAYDRQQEGFYG